MASATAEIILLLLIAGLVGTLAGIGVGSVTSTVGRKRRTRDNLRRRLIETHRAIVVLERAASGARDAEAKPDEGTRLSERIAAAAKTRGGRESEGAERS